MKKICRYDQCDPPTILTELANSKRMDLCVVRRLLERADPGSFLMTEVIVEIMIVPSCHNMIIRPSSIYFVGPTTNCMNLLSNQWPCSSAPIMITHSTLETKPLREPGALEWQKRGRERDGMSEKVEAVGVEMERWSSRGSVSPSHMHEGRPIRAISAEGWAAAATSESSVSPPPPSRSGP